jgi:hypothetical protein
MDLTLVWRTYLPLWGARIKRRRGAARPNIIGADGANLASLSDRGKSCGDYNIVSTNGVVCVILRVVQTVVSAAPSARGTQVVMLQVAE